MRFCMSNLIARQKFCSPLHVIKLSMGHACLSKSFQGEISAIDVQVIGIMCLFCCRGKQP